MSSETSCWPVEPTVELRPLPWIDLELAGNNDMVMWIGLPASVATVELRQGDDVRWQRVVDGVAAFPVASHDPTDEVVAFDASGVEVLRSSWSTVTLTGSRRGRAPTAARRRRCTPGRRRSARSVRGGRPDVDATTLEGDDAGRRGRLPGVRRRRDAVVPRRRWRRAWNACLVSTDAALKAHLAERP